LDILIYIMNRRQFLKLTFYGSVASLAASYPVFIERNIVQINRYKVPIDDLPEAFHGFRLVQLTDLHLGFMVSESFIEGVVEKAKGLNPDVIVCTGDYVHGRNTTAEINKVWPILSKLEAKYGVFSVLGNHDHWADFETSLNWLERSGQNIRHQCKAIYKGKDRIIIGGSGDYWEDELNIDKAFSCSDEGLIETQNTQLFISRGIGWAIYPVRFNCYPEIAVLELMCKA